MPRMAAPILLICVLAVNGCGTIGNIQDRDKVYGGLRLDTVEGCRAWKDLFRPPESPDFTTTQNVAIIILSGIDMPLSLVADTATLPITVTASVRHWIKGPDAPKEEALPPAPQIPPTNSPPPLAAAKTP